MQDDFKPYLNEGGLRPDPPDHRDYLYSAVFAAGEEPEVDWEAGFDNFKALGISPITQDQNGSSSCTCQAVKSHVRKHLSAIGLGDDEISATPNYHAIRLEGGGAYLRDAISFPATVGSIKESVVSSYENGNPPSEDYFTRFVMTEELANLAKRLELFSYRMIPGETSSIDVFAHAILHNQGGIGGYTGTNEGWCRPVVRPPRPGEKKWGHGVSHDAFGLMDVPDYGISVGTKCLFTKNSWGDRYAIKKGRWVGYQAIPESYFSSGEQTASGYIPGLYVYNAWVLVPDDNIDPTKRTMEFIKNHEGQLVMDSAKGRSGAIAWIQNGEMLRASKERVPQMIANYMVEKEGTGVPPEIWDEAVRLNLVKEF